MIQIIFQISKVLEMDSTETKKNKIKITIIVNKEIVNNNFSKTKILRIMLII